jgi:hypothetical protein
MVILRGNCHSFLDQAVLENHHLAAAFALMRNKEMNIFGSFDDNSYAEIRKLIITSVLDSDRSKHFHLLTTLKSKLGSSFPTEKYNDRQVIQIHFWFIFH